MAKGHIEALADQVRALSPAQRLLMASKLLERGKTEMADSIAQSALDELAFARLFPGRPLPKWDV